MSLYGGFERIVSPSYYDSYEELVNVKYELDGTDDAYITAYQIVTGKLSLAFDSVASRKRRFLGEENRVIFRVASKDENESRTLTLSENQFSRLYVHFERAGDYVLASAGKDIRKAELCNDNRAVVEKANVRLLRHSFS